MKVIAKKFSMSIRSNNDSIVYATLGQVVFGLPIIDLSLSEFETLWSTMLPTATTEIYDIFHTLVSYCGGFIRQPWCFPGIWGYSGYSGDIANAQDYNQYAPYYPAAIPLTLGTISPDPGGALRTTFSIDGNNRFSFAPYQSGGSMHLLADNIEYNMGGDDGVGIRPGNANYPPGTTNRIYASILFMTSDSRLVKVRISWNRNNSRYNVYDEVSSSRFLNWFKGVPGGGTGDDPYNVGGVTGPGGGNGDYRLIDDEIDFPSLPTISVGEAGFVSIWVPSLPQLRDLAAFMWCADPTKIDFWKKMITNPIDLILGLQLLPFTIPTELVPANVTLGFIDSGIPMFYTEQQFHEVDCGELDLAEYWGAFLDYAPYTSLEIFLPFIGTRTLNINDCMPKTIHVKYIVDIVTGTCVALIKCGTSVFYHFSGSCAAQVPVTSGQAQQLFGQALQLGVSIAAAAVTGGVAGALSAAVGASSTVASAGGMAGADRSGNMSGTAGFMDTRTPYLIVTRPRQAVPDVQNELTGYPSFITAVMDDLSGYTEIQVTHLHDMTATQPEIEEIVQLLHEGVFF